MRIKITIIIITIILICSILINWFLIYKLYITKCKPNYLNSINIEEFRVTSSDSLFDFVYLSESYGGTLGSVVYHAYIAIQGTDPKPRTQFFVGTHIDLVNILWESNRELHLIYNDASILNFNNDVWVEDKKGVRHNIEIVLRKE